MAEWGKGDPRWIVEERPDAINPNNWHWTEKNATQWSKDKLKDLLVGLKIETDEWSCEIKELKKCDGEASANNRKAKLVFLYEWQIEGKWEGSARQGENQTKYQGGFEIPNLSDENTIDEVTMSFSVEKSKGEKLREMLRKEGQEVIRKKLGDYVRLLKEEFSQGLILPTKTNDKQSATTNNQPKVQVPPPVSSNVVAEKKPGVLELRELKVQDYFVCPKNELFRTFCDLDRVKAFTHNSVTAYDCKRGGFFSLFSDNITGRFLNVVANERLDLLWRFKSWPNDHHSCVSITFHDEIDRTKVVIQQTAVPAQFYDNTMDGWKRFYFESIKSTFGYGSRLF